MRAERRRHAVRLRLLAWLACLLPLGPSPSSALTLEEEGEQLFNNETFNGNGRVCADCHVAAQSFGLTPTGIATLFAADPNDPLFIAENDPALAMLENSCLMRGGNLRGLILENIDGFASDPVFRNSPHLFNLALTAPYGLSGEFANLRDFSDGAVAQHFTQTMSRTPGVDFRQPTLAELQALEAFMQSITFPSDGNLDLNRMIDFHVAMNGADPVQIARGRALFFGPQAQCSRCHSGPALANADGTLGSGFGNVSFNTGVVDLPANLDDGCVGGPGDPVAALPPEAGGIRVFSTPQLLGVANTAPFFHDSSEPTLTGAVLFYDSAEFATSPAAALLGSPIVISFADVLDIVAFLEAISVDATGGLPVPALGPLSWLFIAGTVLVLGRAILRSR